MATVAHTNSHNVAVAVSSETATNPVHISYRISYVFLLCIICYQLYPVTNNYFIHISIDQQGNMKFTIICHLAAFLSVTIYVYINKKAAK